MTSMTSMYVYMYVSEGAAGAENRESRIENF